MARWNGSAAILWPGSMVEATSVRLLQLQDVFRGNVPLKDTRLGPLRTPRPDGAYGVDCLVPSVAEAFELGARRSWGFLALSVTHVSPDPSHRRAQSRRERTQLRDQASDEP